MLNLRHQVRRISGDPGPFTAEPALEVIYRDLFLRELARMGEEDRFFPTGGAANYSLLYLILRIGLEFKPASVLDIGAGQSSLLWSMLRRHGLVGSVLTLESDREWAQRIGDQIDHEILVTPLRMESVNGREARTYDWSKVIGREPFDVIVCDGPNGLPRHSRSGVLNMMATLPADFVLILDDAERPGEQDTIALIHDRLNADGVKYNVGVVRAAKTQAVFAAGRYIPATFL
jgi:hypothetical protein